MATPITAPTITRDHLLTYATERAQLLDTPQAAWLLAARRLKEGHPNPMIVLLSGDLRIQELAEAASAPGSGARLAATAEALKLTYLLNWLGEQWPTRVWVSSSDYQQALARMQQAQAG